MLDENLDRRLMRFFGEEHEVVTVREKQVGRTLFFARPSLASR